MAVKSNKKHKFFGWTSALVKFANRTPWRCYFFVFLLLAGYVLLGALMAMVYSPILATMVVDILTALACYILIVAPPHIFTANSKVNRPVESEEFSSKQKLKMTPWAVVLWLAAFFFGQLLSQMIMLSGDKLYKSYESSLNIGSHDLMVLAVVLVGPIAEELLYRGVIFGALRRWMSIWTAWVIQALVFAGMHMTLVHLPVTFLLGLFNGLLVVVFNHVGYAIISHVIYNMFTTIVPLYLPNWSLNWPIAIIGFVITLGLLITAMAYVLSHSWSKKSTQNIEKS